MISIALKAGEPEYAQIAQQIRWAVACQDLKPGERLPPVRILARRLIPQKRERMLNRLGIGPVLAGPAHCQALPGNPNFQPRSVGTDVATLVSARAVLRVGLGRAGQLGGPGQQRQGCRCPTGTAIRGG